ncbi:MAG: hypothetical protein ACJ8A0_11695 [Microvirga sp.]
MTPFLRSLALVLSVLVGSAALAAAALAAAALAAEVVFPPGSRIGLAPLAGMAPSKRFTGFEDAGQGVAFTFVEMPPDAYREIASGLTAERLKEQGIELKAREELKLGDRNAVLAAGEQKLGELTLRKWFLVVEDPSLTALVIGQALPEAQSRPAAAIKAALTTLAIRPPLAIEDQVSALPFRLTERAGFRPVRAMAGNALFLTDGVKDVVVGAEQPIAIVAQSTAPAPPPPQREAFARQALLSNAIFRDATIERSQGFRQKGAEWHEIVARATEIASGAPVVVTQTIRFAPAGYVRMLGVVKADAREAVLPRFRTLFDGVEVE